MASEQSFSQSHSYSEYNDDCVVPRTGLLPHRERHRKSKSGCSPCKARKVKCDEKRPVCGHCARYYVNLQACIYKAPKRKSIAKGSGRVPSGTDLGDSISPATGESSMSISPSITPLPSAIGQSSEDRLLELKLLFHFSTVTYQHLPGSDSPTGKDMWAHQAPQMAFSSEILLSSILGMAALHLKEISSPDPALEKTILRYCGRALAQQESAEREGRQTPSYIMASWLTITMPALVSRILSRSGPYVLTWREMRAFSRNAVALYQSSQVSFPRAESPKARSASSTSVPLPSGTGLAKTQSRGPGNDGYGVMIPYESTLQSSALSMEYLLHGLSEDDVYARDYSDFVHWLDSIVHAMKAGESTSDIKRRLMGIAMATSLQYIELVKRKDPRALAMLAHYNALLHMVGDTWFINGVPKYNIHGMAGLMPQSWSWAMRWPFAIVSMDEHGQ